MPRAEGLKQFLSPSEGLITEQTRLAPVENSTTDEVNMSFNTNGSVRRRRVGIGAEEGSFPFAIPEAITSASAINYALWKSVGGIGDLDYHVFQINNTLYMLPDSSGNLSDSTSSLTYDLNSNLSDAYIDTSDTIVDMATGEGLLFVTGKKVNPFFIEYDEDTATISATDIPIRIRDLTGLDDGLEIDERPNTLSDEHDYNLNNQGWWQQRRIASGGSKLDPIAQFNTANGAYPSNADIAFLGMVDDGNGDLVFDAEELELLTLGNTPAPKGHFIIDPFNIKYEDLRTQVETGGGGYGLGVPVPGGDINIVNQPYPDWYRQPDYIL